MLRSGMYQGLLPQDIPYRAPINDAEHVVSPRYFGFGLTKSGCVVVRQASIATK